MTNDVLELSVSEFVALANQTLEYAYPNVHIVGELANYRVSKNRWVYFDLKDDDATVRFFGTVYQLPGPLEDGMMLAVRGVPRLHPLYGFSVTIQNIQPVGEGAIKKAAALLEAKLRAEGVFDADRKRPLPYPPQTIGLITSGESAAYRDFMKILTERWGGVHITLIDVQVQGEPAPAQIAAAIEQFNRLPQPPDVIVVTRGGGSAEDLQAFSTEQVTRAVAASRAPTLVAIGHEVDISLAELAADQRASTPSNAAELLVPDKGSILRHLYIQRQRLADISMRTVATLRQDLRRNTTLLHDAASQIVFQTRQQLDLRLRLLEAYNPQIALERGYALVHQNGTVVRNAAELKQGVALSLQFVDGRATAIVSEVQRNEKQRSNNA
jgi:exodeoxyribonuclease VII large subunit